MGRVFDIILRCKQYRKGRCIMTSFYSKEELNKIGFKEIGDKNILISRKASIYGADKISIGNNVRIDDFCILSGKIEIGNFVHIAAGVYLFGGEVGIVMEDFTGLSSRTVVYAESDDYSGIALTNPTIPDKYRKVTGGEVIIKKHALVGTGCTILPSVIIGQGTSVGSMSLVNKSLEEWGIYVGIPCKKAKERSKEILEHERRFYEDRLVNDVMLI